MWWRESGRGRRCRGRAAARPTIAAAPPVKGHRAEPASLENVRYHLALVVQAPTARMAALGLIGRRAKWPMLGRVAAVHRCANECPLPSEHRSKAAIPFSTNLDTRMVGARAEYAARCSRDQRVKMVCSRGIRWDGQSHPPCRAH